ncbi:hypothetical protein F2Q70_00007047 [Brassica cretica]|uniref:Uncharacterized protein n=1 Tax=Brassica cretica TaxID=69181 RepID=A0A3N6RDB0_BRACR|nr:hypothetical protein F2Q70_00007047 [Brassica cretica]KAF3543271.1 hypothetical protein DY000_02000101 [Brassica cretica]
MTWNLMPEITNRRKWGKKTTNWPWVVFSGLTLLSEKRHPMMAFSHMDVALWIVCYHCSSPTPLQFVSSCYGTY